MNLLQQTQIESSVYSCAFSCLVRAASIRMKFPCCYFVQWTTSSGKSIAITSQYKPQEGNVYFNEKITLTTEMILNHSTAEYSKKETLIQLFLVSKSRPDQNKLVGRVAVDLAKIINFDIYAQPTEFQLNFCSVPASLTMQFEVLDRKLTSIKVQQLDKSSFIDYLSQIALKHPKSSTVAKMKDSLGKIISSGTEQNQIKSSLINEFAIVSPKQHGDNKAFTSIQNGQNSRGERLRTSDVGKQSVNGKSSVVKDKKVQFNTMVNRMSFGGGQDIRVSHNSQREAPKKKYLSIQIEEQTHVTVPPRIERKALQSVVTEMARPPIQNNILQTFSPNYKAQGNIEQQCEVVELDQIVSQMRLDEVKAQQPNPNNNENKLHYKIQQIQNHLSNARQQLSQLRQELRGKQKQIYKLCSNTERNEQLLTKYQTQLEQLNIEVLHLNQDIQERNTIIAELKKQLIIRDEKYLQLQNSLRLLQQQQYNMVETITIHEKDDASFEAREATYQEQIAELNRLLIEFQSKEETLKNQINQLEYSLQSEKNYNQNLKSQNLALRNVNEQIQAKIEYINAKVNDSSKPQPQPRSNKQFEDPLIATNNIETNRLKDQNYLLQSSLAQQTQLKQKLYQEIQQLRQVIENIKTSNQLLRSEDLKLIDQLKSELTISQNNCNTVNDHLKALQQDHSHQSKVQSLVNETNSLNQSIYKLGEELVSCRNELNRMASDNDNLLRQIADLQRQNTQLRRGKNDTTMINKIKNLEQSVAKYQSELQIVVEKLNSSNDLLKDKQKRLDNLQKEKQTLQKNIDSQKAELNREIAKLKEKIIATSAPPQIKQEDIWQERIQEYEKRVANLNFHLQEQINRNNELSETILNYMQKQAKMKETLNILDIQSKQVFDMFKQKEHNEENYLKMIDQLKKQMERMSHNFYEIHRQDPVTSSTKIIISPVKQQIRLNNREDNDDLLRLQQENLDLTRQIQKLRNDYRNASIEYQSQVQRLTHDLINATNSFKKENIQTQPEFERQLQKKEMEIQIWKSRNKQSEELKHKFEYQLQNLQLEMETIQEEKFILESTNNEKDIKIMELEQELSEWTIQFEANQVEKQSDVPRNQRVENIAKNQKVQSLCSTILQLKNKLLSHTISSDWDALMKSNLDRSILSEQQGKLISIEEKSRLLSKQLQKFKAQLLKAVFKNQQQRLSFMNLIKRCESIVTQLIILAESLSFNQSSFL